MAKTGHRFDILHPKHLNPENVTFSMFTAEEIKKLSVVEILTPLMFDTLGNPVPGGLYDKRLGNFNKNVLIYKALNYIF